MCFSFFKKKGIKLMYALFAGSFYISKQIFASLNKWFKIHLSLFATKKKTPSCKSQLKFMHPVEKVKYDVGEHPLILVEGEDMWIDGKIIQVLEDNTYRVMYISKDRILTTIVSMGEIRKNSIHKDTKDLTKELSYILFNGNDKTNLKKIFAAMMQTLLSEYLDIFHDYDGEEYFEGNYCNNTTSMVTTQILVYVYPPTCIWKVPCLFCRRPIHNENAKQSMLLIRFTRQWIFERVRFYRDSLLYDDEWYGKMACMLCFRYIYDNELVISCTLQRHGLCFECYHAIVSYFVSTKALLHSLLNPWLNKDCISHIVAFTAGDFRLLKNTAMSVPWYENFET
ncbi:hypothetical protein RFI_04193 [Reticulomyxa filosa]|uniref:Uncharacterized protein n=1 Tax=Reticulomyxa filosa TaxID=46433 RepID=X6P478_RETFI|nr:hypothetical protein RFI_04193 [Reticulomyxa filosa]|eukprot:ETO32923.1 hypothetical protein RFI_04193 [Reticulomyxa filosa]